MATMWVATNKCPPTTMTQKQNAMWWSLSSRLQGLYSLEWLMRIAWFFLHAAVRWWSKYRSLMLKIFRRNNRIKNQDEARQTLPTKSATSFYHLDANPPSACWPTLNILKTSSTWSSPILMTVAQSFCPMYYQEFWVQTPLLRVFQAT